MEEGWRRGGGGVDATGERATDNETKHGHTDMLSKQIFLPKEACGQLTTSTSPRVHIKFKRSTTSYMQLLTWLQ